MELIRREYKGAVLCPFPWCEDELQLELSNVFTRLQIVSKKKERAKQTDDNVNMTDVFRPHAECAKPRVVLIEGDPGMGKTTYCQKLAYDWSMGEIPPEASFPKVEMLLLLKCRDMNTAYIEDAIGDQLLPQDVDEKEKENFFHFIRSNQSRVLLVLDDLDELRQDLFQGFLPLIQGRVFFNIYVMLTTRHEVGMKVRRYCDTLLEIVGYTHNDADSYIKKYFSNHEDPSLAEKMIKKLQSDKQLRELTANPLNTSLLCLICEETGGMFPSKRTKMYDALVECALRRYFAKRGVPLDEDNPMESFADQLNQLGKMAFEALLKSQLYFSAVEMKCQSTDFLQLCFLSREPSVSKIRPTPCYAFTHKTFQEYFAALYLAHLVLTGDQGAQALLAQLSPIDNWQVWEFLFTMVTSKNSDMAVLVLSRLCSFFYHRRTQKVIDTTVEADADSDDICEKKPPVLKKYLRRTCSGDEKELIDVVTKTLHLIAECEDSENELKDYQKKLVHVMARCFPVYLLELARTSRYCLVYSEYLKTNSTLVYLQLDSPLNNSLLKTISDVFHPKHKLVHLSLFDHEAIYYPLIHCFVSPHQLISAHVSLGRHINWTMCFFVPALAEVLKSGRLLTHLNLEHVWLFNEGVQTLTEVLQANHALTHLNLGMAMISDPGAIVLGCFLQSNCTLSHLSLPENWISGVGAGALADGLQSNRALKCLNLSENLGGDSVAVALARAVESECTLTYLDLSQLFFCTEKNVPFPDYENVHVELIGPSGASSLARALRLNGTLTYLDLRHNAVGDTGAAAVAEALKSNCTLTELYLMYNQIGETGAEALGTALQSNCTLTHLGLQGNCMGDSGAKAIAKALQSSGIQLTRLGLSVNEIGCSGATAIADSLQCNRSLTRLGLKENKIGSSGAIAVAKALQTNCTLTHLDMLHNDINDSGATELAQALLYHNNTLIYLDLKGNPIGTLGAEILGAVSERSSCILKYDRPRRQTFSKFIDRSLKTS